MRLLTIDIGNTNINLAIFQGDKIIKRFIIPTKDYSLLKLKRYLGRAHIDDAIICSVVPRAAKPLEKDLKLIFGKQPLCIGKNTVVPIKNLYRKPREVGQDRLVNAYAGVKLYGAPLVVVDFGTAITFDVISRKKEYLGGMILPGLNISLEALNQRTALLPKIKLEAPKELIGRDTKSSMLGGIVFGFASLADDLSARIKNKIGKEAKVIATGGNIRLIAKYCKNLDKTDADLTLKGLFLAYKNC
jgi:type III pantothenate kinase